jgi:hypothetical protein
MEEKWIQDLAENIHLEDTRADGKIKSNIRNKEENKYTDWIRVESSGSGCRSVTECKIFGMHSGR